MSDELPKLPLGWAWTTLAEVADVRLGRQRSPKHEYGPYLRPYLRAANVTWQGVDLTDVKEMNFTPEEFETYRLVQGDILLTEASGSVSEVGKPAMWSGEIRDICFQNTLVRVRPRGVLSEYLYLVLLIGARDGGFVSSAQGVGLNHIGVERIAKWPVALPPLREQEEIVAAVSVRRSRVRNLRADIASISSLMGTYRKSILAAAYRGDLTSAWRAEHDLLGSHVEFRQDLRKERRQRWENAIFSRLVSQGRTPEDDQWKTRYEEPAEPARKPLLPASWDVASLEEVSDPTRVVRYGILMPGLNVAGGVPYVKVRDIKNNKVDLKGIHRTTTEIHAEFRGAELAVGDVLVSIRGTVGKVALVPPELSGGNVTQDTARVAPIIDARYLAWILRAPQSQEFLRTVGKGVAVQGINISDLRRAAIPICSTQEQVEVVARVEVFNDTIDRFASSLESLQGQADVLDRVILRKALSGGLSSQDPLDEPASQLLGRIQKERELMVASKPPVRRRAKKTDQSDSLAAIDGVHDLFETLLTHGGSLPPEELFRRSGHSAVNPEHLERFYRSLRESVAAGRLRETRQPDGTPKIEVAT